MEYDPFKFMSFAVNAGDVVYQLALRNQSLLSGLTPLQREQIPAILSFQSVADATVSSAAVVSLLYQTLPQKGHELVLFDMNRTVINSKLMTNDPLPALLPTASDNIHYRGTLIENINSETTQVQAREFGFRPQDESLSQIKHLPLYWPAGVYSLSHVALPFAENDGLYGMSSNEKLTRIQIGAAASRGERGVYSVPASEMLRQKWNPFFPYMMERIEQYRSAHMPNEAH